MGGERAATTRRRLAGVICCMCKATLGPPAAAEAQRGERFCDRCTPRPHRVYAHFMRVPGCWFVQFLEADCKTPLRRKLRFADEQKIRDLALRGHASRILEDVQAMEYAIANGRGSLWLNLSEAQYRTLK